MNIALIAQDSKKELMVQFCIAYCGILSRHRNLLRMQMRNPGTFCSSFILSVC